MVEVNKEDYISWRHHPVSQAFIQAMQEKIDEEMASLVMSAGDNPLSDKTKVGRIDGLRWLVDWEPLFAQQPEVNIKDEQDDS